MSRCTWGNAMGDTPLNSKQDCRKSRKCDAFTGFMASLLSHFIVPCAMLYYINSIST